MHRKITAQEGWTLVNEYTRPLDAIKVDVADALSSFLAVPIKAPISLPPFDNSAVDGYALGREAEATTCFDIVGTIGAGQSFKERLGVSDACRIMTGAKIPEGTKAIAMQEHVRVANSQVILKHAACSSDHIRKAGEDVALGARVLEQGKCLSPADVALLCALGIHEVEVRRSPTVAIVSTGSELVEPGQKRAEGQVYYCTGPMLSALCQTARAKVSTVAKIGDDEDAIVAALKQESSADVLIMVGGMADGLYDHGRRAFEKIGVEAIFFEGQWRPGKPLFFGRLGHRLVFGLPGNPVAAFVMFKVFVEPALQKMRGGSGLPVWQKATAAFEMPQTSGRSLFLRGKVLKDGVGLLPGQGSHQLFTLSQANAIVWVDPNSVSGSEVDYLALEP